jgi:hypothetical protein
VNNLKCKPKKSQISSFSLASQKHLCIHHQAFTFFTTIWSWQGLHCQNRIYLLVSLGGTKLVGPISVYTHLNYSEVHHELSIMVNLESKIDVNIRQRMFSLDVSLNWHDVKTWHIAHLINAHIIISPCNYIHFSANFILIITSTIESNFIMQEVLTQLEKIVTKP